MNSESENLYQYDEEFRNTIATVDEKGKRVWIYPKRPSGRLHNYRIAVTLGLLTLFFAGPFIRIGGQPLLMLNLFDRRFVVFGQVFWPQDFFLLALTLITLFVFVILFTVVFGRVWCGWACPQTLFMEMVFRKIEYWIEGDANQQRKLTQQPWNTEKIIKKAGKQLVFILISVIISHTALAYLIGIEEVKEIVSQPPTEHLAGFIGLVAFTGIFYFVFAWFREQACIAVCPYGRLQGVLLVKDSIVVAYDWLRGEPRKKLKKGDALENRGDCIDCRLCVHACPTGIDIRNGTQLECVNCTACIDACDDVMLKIGKPKGLIRFASYNSIKDGVKNLLTMRVAGYSMVLLGLVVLLSFMVATRSDIETTILKVPGTLYQRSEDGKITNLYNIEFVNKTFEEITLSLRAESPAGVLIRKVGEPEIIVPAGELYKAVCFIEIPADQVTTSKMIVGIGVYRGEERIETIKAKFIGPVHSHKDRVKGKR
ncbi:cytochrome c oxidase accessory protein CcoG [Oscillatoria amoena NRMC-F 0135]|nr:cytochrome c oxidase accessory protein CcoG [Oscillatoria amoena NRMC-F 0135]